MMDITTYTQTQKFISKIHCEKITYRTEQNMSIIPLPPTPTHTHILHMYLLHTHTHTAHVPTAHIHTAHVPTAHTHCTHTHTHTHTHTLHMYLLHTHTHTHTPPLQVCTSDRAPSCPPNNWAIPLSVGGFKFCLSVQRSRS